MGQELNSKNALAVSLSSYQRTVRFLIEQYDFPGVTMDELDAFKSQFRSSAFTCRLRSGPNATAGFESERERNEHELAHSRRYSCNVPDCKYPSFSSPTALKSHLAKYHTPTRNSVRKSKISKVGQPLNNVLVKSSLIWSRLGISSQPPSRQHERQFISPFISPSQLPMSVPTKNMLPNFPGMAMEIGRQQQAQLQEHFRHVEIVRLSE